jgi:hypothetical protein
VLVAAGITLYPSLRERYWLWKLRDGDESEKEKAVCFR